MLSKKGSNKTSIETLALFLQSEGFSVKRASSKNNKVLRLLDMLFSILKNSKKVDYVLIDTYSTSGFWFAYYSAILCIKLNIDFIPILRGGNLPDRLKKSPKQCNLFFSKANINIAPSNYLFEAFKEAGFKNVKLIPNSIEIENYDFKIRASIKPNLLWVRAFAEIYNPILALKVLKQLLKDYPNAQLSMVGPFRDNSIDECKSYANKHNLPVKFTGKMDKAEWIDYSKNFDVFINTTNVDNTPVSVIEAMALGLPIVTTNVGGLPYLLKNKEEAILVNPNDVTEMHNAILKLLKDQDFAQKLSENGRKLTETFDWSVVKNQWKDVLK